MASEDLTDVVRTKPGLAAACVLAIIVAAATWVGLNSRSTPAVDTPPAVEPDNATPSTIPSAEDVFENTTEGAGANEFALLGSAASSDVDLSFVQLAPRGSARPSSALFSLTDGIVSSTELSASVSRWYRNESELDHPGEVRHQMLDTDAGVVVVHDDQAMLYRFGETPVALGGASSLLRGPTQSSVWIIDAERAAVRWVELSTESPGTSVEHDLASIGRPIDSASRGLVVALSNRDSGADFGFWTPASGVIEFAGTQRLSYLGSGGSHAVFTGAAVALVLNTNDPSEPGRVLTIPGDDVHRSAVSPLGTYLASSIVTDETELNWMSIIDLRDGTELGQIDSSVEIGFRWSSNTSLVYLRPDWPAIDLVERDVVAGVDRNLIRFDDRSWWVAVNEQP